MANKPSTPFDYDALDDAADELRELRAFRERTEDHAARTLRTVTAFLFAGRNSPWEMVKRLVAFGIASGHPEFTGKSRREIARKFGLSRTAIGRLADQVATDLRRLADLSKMESGPLARRQTRKK